MLMKQFEQLEEQFENKRILDELKHSYLNYAMSVIVSRALPDVRDGLKPSQRRILVAMNDLSLGPRSKHRKCAKIVGDTGGNYHPHGDQATYGTLVRLGQGWNMRDPVVLPARFPNLLVNGSTGIAVGMATNLAPHNLGEVCDALLLVVNDPKCG